jgi:hypothetical protein
MSACPKLEYDDEEISVEAPAPPPETRWWWRGAIHLLALVSILGLGVLFSLFGLIWLSLTMEPG